MPSSKGQWVWPKDGRASQRPKTTWFGRFSDILTNKGPDIFVTKPGGKVHTGEWSNWDGYHHRNAHYLELISSQYGRFLTTRDKERYDPHSRKYMKWSSDNDFNGSIVNSDGYPSFTDKEWKRMLGVRHRKKRFDPNSMPDWNWLGPKRFRQENDPFWHRAHLVGLNRENGLSLENKVINANRTFSPVPKYGPRAKQEYATWKI